MRILNVRPKSRLKSYTLWVAIFAFIPILLDALGAYNVFIYLPDNYELLVKAILNIAVLLGLIVNPEEDPPPIVFHKFTKK